MLDLRKMIASAYECLGWPYVSPGSNDANGIDCSGLFVKMYRDQGARIYHGSNTIYREYCTEDKGEIRDISQLEVGMAVFKWNPHTPEKFHDDLGDFQHIGFVVGVGPLKIIHASSAAGCVTIDEKLGKWKYFGKLKDVDYSGGVEPGPGPEPAPVPEPAPEVVYATVYSDNRKPVKMRAKASASCRLYDDVPFGAIVEVTERDCCVANGETWSQVNYGNRRGWYMMSKFLLIDETSIPGISGKDDGFCSVMIPWISEEEALRIKEQYPEAEITYG